ncbi:MAG: hypothetical protein J2P57_13245 [Acidimicrobiaceae bacterium]|nr:hypothetical protein [Acidimicrobiaceae bacterium]
MARPVWQPPKGAAARLGCICGGRRVWLVGVRAGICRGEIRRRGASRRT